MDDARPTKSDEAAALCFHLSGVPRPRGVREGLAAWAPGKEGPDVEMYFRGGEMYCRFSRPVALADACRRFYRLADRLERDDENMRLGAKAALSPWGGDWSKNRDRRVKVLKESAFVELYDRLLRAEGLRVATTKCAGETASFSHGEAEDEALAVASGCGAGAEETTASAALPEELSTERGGGALEGEEDDQTPLTFRTFDVRDMHGEYEIVDEDAELMGASHLYLLEAVNVAAEHCLYKLGISFKPSVRCKQLMREEELWLRCVCVWKHGQRYEHDVRGCFEAPPKTWGLKNSEWRVIPGGRASVREQVRRVRARMHCDEALLCQNATKKRRQLDEIEIHRARELALIEIEKARELAKIEISTHLREAVMARGAAKSEDDCDVAAEGVAATRKASRSGKGCGGRLSNSRTAAPSRASAVSA